MLIQYNCRYYRGDLPCFYKRICEDCPHYSPIQERILVRIKDRSYDHSKLETAINDLALKHTVALIHVQTLDKYEPSLENIPRIDRIYDGTFKGRLSVSGVKYDQFYDFINNIFIEEVVDRQPHPSKELPTNKKILIIKFAAIGDVLRTTTILPALKEKHSQAKIEWICENDCESVLKNNTYLSKVHAVSENSINEILKEHWAAVYNFDKDDLAIALATQMSSEYKYGFGASDSGTVNTLNELSLYSLSTGIDDELKFKKNQKTYQEIICEMAEVSFEHHPYILNTSTGQKKVTNRLLENSGSNDKIRIGLNTGCGNIFPLKKWPRESFVELIRLLSKHREFSILLLGGPEEQEDHPIICRACPDLVYDTGTHNSIEEFFGVVDACHMIVTADTAAMHFGIAMHKYVLALMGPTSTSEIDLYQKGRILHAGFDCTGCERSKCHKHPTCMESIGVDTVYQEIMTQSKNITI